MGESNDTNDLNLTNLEVVTNEASSKAMDLADIIIQGSSDGVLDDQALQIIETLVTTVLSEK